MIFTFHNYIKVSLLSIGCLFLSVNNSEAVHFQKVTSEKTEVAKPKRTIIKKWTKKIEKFFSKSERKMSSDKIKNLAIIALILGILSLILLPLTFIIGYSFILILAALAAIAGDVISILTLRKIKNSENPEVYRRSKILSITGLILSLLTGLIPLALLVLVLIAL